MGTGFVAFGFALAVGVVSVGINAVGFVAIGINAVGFVSLGAVNALGVFAFGGVNMLGGWGAGGVNAVGSHWFGLVASALGAVGVTVARMRTWPRRDDIRLVPLATALEGDGEQARARLIEIGEEIVVRDGRTTGRARANDGMRARCASLGQDARVIVAFKQEAVLPHDAGYRDAPASFVLELARIRADTRPPPLVRLFGGALGASLFFAWVGLAAAIVAFAVSR